MTDTLDTDHPQQKDESKPDATEPARGPGRWRSIVRVVLAALLGVLVLATVHQMRYEPVSIDGAYEWTLRWPGTPPGAKFRTRPGDTIRRVLDHLLADTGADWQGLLTEAGTIEIQLSRPAYPSLWTLLKWRIRGPSGPEALGKAERVLLVLQVKQIGQSPPRYEVATTVAGGRERISETYESYQDAQEAVLDALARVMDKVQME